MGMNECCFCWTYRKGAIITGFAGAILGVVSILIISSLTFDEKDKPTEFTKEDYPFTVFTFVVYIVTHLLLSYGAWKVKHHP